jgi:hypothetical protein
MGDEGKVEGGGKSADGRTVVEGAGMGETVGAITRGLGGAAGALAGVLLSRNQNAVLEAATHLEMALDRDLVLSSGRAPIVCSRTWVVGDPASRTAFGRNSYNRTSRARCRGSSSLIRNTMPFCGNAPVRSHFPVRE